MIGQVLKAAHDLLGHNGIGRTYAAVKKLYYWKGMKPVITKYIQNCYKCQQRNRQVIKYNKLHFDTASFPMEFISMDLIGEFHPPSKKGNKYALPVICMLTGYVFCVSLKSRTACEVIQAYIDNIYAAFGGSREILSDNRTEFKNQMFENIAQELGVEYKKYTAPYHPSSNGKIEGFHNFLKACLAKHISGKLEWDEVTPLACAAYNFMPNENSRESPFFLMFARDPILPLNTLLCPKIRYMGNDHNIISLEAMKSMFELVTVNLKKARARKDPEHFPDVTQLQEGDTVMIKNHTAKAFEPKYVGDYRIIRITGHKVLLKSLKTGQEKEEHLDHIKYVLPADRHISALPDYEQFGRKTNLRLNPDKIPDLEWELSDKLHTTNIGQVVRPDTRPPKEKDCVTIEIDTIFVNVYSYTYQKIACTSTTHSGRRQPICHVLSIQMGKRIIQQ